MFQKIIAYILLLTAVALFYFFLNKPLTSLDNRFTDLQFELRGEIKTDSSIITLYIDKAIMDSLGRVPLKWIYYAKIIDALSNLGVKAIGIDIVFDKNSPDYPRQASWLITSIRNSGRVCVGGFFDKIESNTIQKAESSDSEVVSSARQDSSELLYGKDLEIPFPWLLENAAGFGHLNFEDDISIRKVPLALTNADSNYNFINNSKFIPALTIELLRIYYNIPKESIEMRDKSLVMKNGDSTIVIPTDHSQMLINYCGGINSLNMLPISNFLKMYENYIETKTLTPELSSFKDKIALIGLMGKRTTQFASTPFDNNFPFIGIHANILDTILRQRFLYEVPFWITVLISVALASLIFWFITSKRLGLLRSLLIAGIFILGYIVFTFFLFRMNVILSIQPAVVAFLSVLSASAYQFNMLLLHSKKTEREKYSIESILNKSRQKIFRLEETLHKFKNGIHKNESIEGGLLNDYHSELIDLTTKFEDLSAYKHTNQPEKKIEFYGIVYNKNSRMEEVVNLAKKIAPTDATVLLLGETGTGKELIAKAIHNLSDRKNNNFITINCGAIPETLLESELFGHEEGAYTGADKLHKGYFETANKGTIFLDEITSTNEMFQTKLLRVLQSGEFNRVGSSETIKVDVRVISASNKNIDALVKEKKIREDLYYRLNVIKIFIPPLRSRKSDIPVLTKYFLDKEGAGHLEVSNSVIEAFLAYNWPGNIRQLENVIKRSVILAKVENSNLIQLKKLPPEIISSLKSIQDIEEQVITKLRENGFSHSSITNTANELGGLHRGTVAEYLRGVCFREFCEHHFDIESAVISIAGTDDKEVQARVKNKMEEYLNNLLRNIDKEISLEQLKEKLNYKFKKFPNRYHTYLEELIEYYYNSQEK